MGLCAPVARWGRLRVEGLDSIPESGPLLVVGNHDSHWDPVMVGVAARSRRQIRALAKSTLWDVRGLGPILDGMGQIPIERGAGDAQALSRAIEALRQGTCIGVFPEGTRSRGKVLRARSGVGRLALEVPETRVILVAIEGTSDLTGFPGDPGFGSASSRRRAVSRGQRRTLAISRRACSLRSAPWSRRRSPIESAPASITSPDRAGALGGSPRSTRSVQLLQPLNGRPDVREKTLHCALDLGVRRMIGKRVQQVQPTLRHPLQ